LSIVALSAILISSISPSGAVIAQDRSNDGHPIVKITDPANNSTYSWNSLVRYHIVVSYQGKSTQYQELPANQVLLTATYVPDLSSTAPQPAAAASPAPAGLLNIIQSNCLGCHQFRAKSMAPSFSAIAARYPRSPATADTLSRKIRSGSSGAWGQQSMPPHPELTEGQAHAIALWIMQHAANPNVNYFVGTEGTIRMSASGAPGAKAGIILTASYTGSAATGHPGHAPRGQDSVVVHGN
jgi:cytochrome c551/c552